jgi:hypothetical protein
MKARDLVLFLIAVLAGVMAPTAALAIDVTATYRIENLAFDPDRKSTDNSFSGSDFPMGFSLGVSETSQQDLSMKAEYVHDAVLRNILTGLVTYRGNMFSFGVGPFVGFLNTDQLIPKVGVASSFTVEWPGAAFVQLWLDNSSANRLADEGDYLQERNNISLGFYVPNAICSVNLLNKRFSEMTALGEVTDSMTEYSFVADIYHKNVPFKIVVKFGLQSVTRDFDIAGPDATHTLNSIVLGTRFDMNVTESVAMTIDLDSSLYTWGQDDLIGISNPGTYLFRAVAGVTVNASKLLGLGSGQ